MTPVYFEPHCTSTGGHYFIVEGKVIVNETDSTKEIEPEAVSNLPTKVRERCAYCGYKRLRTE